MNTQKYTYLLAHPQNIGKEDLVNLGVIIEKYPYFQSARALQLKALKNQNSFLYNDALKITAAYTADRNILFDYITSEHFIQNEIAQEIQQLDSALAQIEVASENVSEQLSVELAKQIKVELKKAEAILNPDLFKRKIADIPATEDTPVEIAAEEALGVNQPLQFTKNDTHSFGEWLKLSKATPIKRNNENKISVSPLSEQQRKLQLIEKFIQEKPKLKPTEIKIQNNDLAEQFTQSSDALMTETLARVFVQQRNYSKAVQAYKILILKYPEKSGFFADQIRTIQKLINTEKQ